MKQTHGEYCSLDCGHWEWSRFEESAECRLYKTYLEYDRAANQIRRCAACIKGE